jgi:hypothetical protein
MFIYMGMYLHFCRVHGEALGWNPWAPQVPVPAERPKPVAERVVREPVGV